MHFIQVYVLYKFLHSLQFSVENLDNCDHVFGKVIGGSNVVSKAAAPIMHQEVTKIQVNKQWLNFLQEHQAKANYLKRLEVKGYGKISKLRFNCGRRSTYSS